MNVDVSAVLARHAERERALDESKKSVQIEREEVRDRTRDNLIRQFGAVKLSLVTNHATPFRL